MDPKKDPAKRVRKNAPRPSSDQTSRARDPGRPLNQQKGRTGTGRSEAARRAHVMMTDQNTIERDLNATEVNEQTTSEVGSQGADPTQSLAQNPSQKQNGGANPSATPAAADTQAPDRAPGTEHTTAGGSDAASQAGIPDLRHAGPEVVAVEDRARWHEIRSKTIGASESAALLISTPGDEIQDSENYLDEEGEPISPYASPYELWALKTGRLTPIDAEKRNENQRTRWGREFEPLIAEGIARQRGWTYRRPEGYYLMPGDPAIGASLDFEVDVEGLGVFEPFEIKNVAGTEQWRWKNALGEWVVPPWIQVQVQHQLLVTGHERGFVGVLFGGCDDRAFEIRRDDGLIAEINEAIHAFWEMVADDEPPAPDWKRDVDVVKKLFTGLDPEHVEDWRDRDDLMRIASEQKHHAQQKRYHEEEAKRLNAQLQEALGDASAAVLSPDLIIKASRVEGSEVSYFREPYKQLRIGKPPKRHAGAALERVLGRKS